MQVPSTVLRSSNATIYVVSSTSISKSADTSSRTFLIRFGRRFRARCCLSEKPAAIRSSLRVLEWDKLCDVVSSFSGTSLGRQALKEQLWSLDQTYDDSLRLLEETNAAVEMHKCCEGMLDFTGIDVLLVRSAIEHARRSLPVDGREAMAVATLLQFADALQINIKAAIKENLDQHTRFMPLAQPILDWVISRSLARLILQFVEEDGSIKDSASSKLKQARARVQELERKLHQLMDVLIGSELDETPSLEVSNVDGRWCIRSGTDQLSSFKGLLLSSGAGVGTIVEPLSAVPINDELQQAKASVAEAEAEVLVDITAKMQPDLDVMEKLLDSVIQLDVVNARATYGISFGGACPDLFRLDDKTVALTSEDSLSKTSTLKSDPSTKKWKLYLPKAYHPLLIQQYQHSLQEARKDVAKATAEIRRRRMQGIRKDKTDIDLPSLQKKVNQIEGSQPVPVDILIEKNVRVLLITGPNTGGKTICLKTVGLAAMMAKAGLYVLCSESAQIPWFDSIFADIGDEQSLSQSLSTFSGHLKQISDIQANSTSKSVVLLDEIGAGTNPLEGAALGMSILESFAEAGASLTIATTHHGELKTLKYSNGAFENACMEFDEVNLKPTYKILWGVPGRSNAINIAERLGLPKRIIDNARQLYGTSSAEIDEVVADMEKFKRDAREYIHEAQHYLSLSKHIHEKLLLTKRKLAEHSSDLRYTKIQQISKIAALARSTIHEKMRQRRASARQESHHPMAVESHREEPVSNRHSTETDLVLVVGPESSSSAESVKKSSSEIAKEIPKIGDTVHVPSLGTKAKVLQVELPKKEIVVQAGNLKLKLKLSDVTT